MKLALLLLLSVVALPVRAQLTLGATMSDLQARYRSSPQLTDWQASVSEQGDSTVIYRNLQDESVITSYFLPVAGQKLVVASTVLGDATTFYPRFLQQCRRYKADKPGEYLDIANGLKYVIGRKDGVAFMRVTLLH